MLFVSHTHSILWLVIGVKNILFSARGFVNILFILNVCCLALLFNINIWILPQMLKIVDIAIFDSIISEEAYKNNKFDGK